MNPAALVDDLLELAVVPSFGRTGSAIRRRLWGWQDPRPDALEGRTALVTGPTGGLGRATATAFAALGARVILVGRDPGRLEALRTDLIASHGEDRFPAHVADLSSLASVDKVVQAIRAAETRLDIVVDNAGAIRPDRSTTSEGIEQTLALMVLGPFALVGGILPLLTESPDARVIAVASGGMYAQALDLDDLEGDHMPYSGPRSYARAKRAQVTLIREWSRRLAGGPIAFASMHPGWARTPGLSASLPGFERIMGPLLRSPEEGIDTTVWLATTPDASQLRGRFFLDRRPRPFDRVPMTILDAADRRRLWAQVVALTGRPDPAP